MSSLPTNLNKVKGKPPNIQATVGRAGCASCQAECRLRRYRGGVCSGVLRPGVEVYDTMARGFLSVSNKVLDLGLKPVGNYITIADTDAITIMLLCQEGRVVGSVDHKKRLPVS